jgi:outer membrane lipoprotein-sorting protein
MQQNFLVDKVVGSHSKVTNILRNKDGQERVRESTTTTRLEDNGADTQRIVRFYAPADVNGTSILLIEHSKSDDDIWIYLPALKKVRRLVASNKRDSFAGTDFSYGDVIGYAVDDWRHTLVGEDTLNGEPCFLVESVPTSQIVKETSGYSKRRNCISKSRYTTLRTEVWDTEGQLLKEEAYSNFQNVDPAHGKWVAMRSTARNVQTGHTTEVVFKDYSIDPSVSAALFTTRTLEFGS